VFQKSGAKVRKKIDMSILFRTFFYFFIHSAEKGVWHVPL
jgi:hypothetical protein